MSIYFFRTMRRVLSAYRGTVSESRDSSGRKRAISGAWLVAGTVAAFAAMTPSAALAQSEACTAINNGYLDFDTSYTSTGNPTTNARSSGVAGTSQGIRSSAYTATSGAYPSTGALYGSGTFAFAAGETIDISVTTISVTPGSSGDGFRTNSGISNANTGLFTTIDNRIINTAGTYTSSVVTTANSNAIFVRVGRSTPDWNGSFQVRVTCTAPAPTINSIAPASGSSGGGTPVTITGTNFVNTSTYTATFGGSTVPAIYASATTLTATTPAGTGSVTVSATDTTRNVAASGAATFTYAAPTVTALSATSGPANQPRAVTITGTNFTPTATVTVDGVAATGVTFVSATQLNATLPARPAGTYGVRVTTGSVTTAANPPADQYTYVAAPTLTSLTPNSGTTAGGTSVTITGTNFTGATAVTFGGAAAQSFVVNSATQITAVTPGGSAGAADVAVTTGGGTATAAGGFTYVLLTAPVVSADPQDQTVAVGATATFNAAASGSPAPTQQWQISTNGGPFTDIAGATGPSYTTPATVASDNGNRYRAVFTNGQGTVTTNAATLAVVQAPTANAQSVAVPFNTATAITLTGTDPNTPARTLTYNVATGPARGTLSGTAPNLTYTPTTNARGSDSFTFTVSNGVATSVPATFSITIADPTLTIAGTPPAGQRGTAYDFTFTTGGGSGSYSYAITSGALPAGLTLSSAGRIAGTPAASGSFPVTVTVTDAGLGSPPVTRSQIFTIAVAAPTLTASPPPTLPGGTVGVAYSVLLTTNGGTAPYTYAVTAGSLPAGMTLGTDGRFFGTPTQAGGYSFSVTATDSSTPESGGPYTLTVAYSGNFRAPTIAVTPASIPQPQVGVAYTADLGATGGTPPYTFTVSAGALPNGLSLSSAGVLSGTPTAGGAYSFTIQARDSSTGTGAPFAGSQLYSGTVFAPAITIAPGALPTATGGQPFSQALTASGGIAPYSYAVTAGALPTGVTLSPTGVLSGTPTVQGSFEFTVTATDSSTGGPNPGGRYAGSAAYTLSVGAPTIVVLPETLPASAVAATYSQTLTASGGTGTYTFDIATGALPAGLTLASDGVLSGTPTAGGSFGFTARATDVNGFTGTRAYTLAVGAPTIAIAPATVSDATRFVAYSQTLAASGGTAPYAFAVTAGALPAGVNLAADGTLSGTPTSGGSFAFTVTTTDASTGTGPFAGSQNYSLTVVVPDIQITPAALAQGTTRVTYSQTLTAAGGVAPYSFAVTAGALPGGITLAADGTLAGTTTQAGDFAFTATATDANGNSGEQAYTLVFETPAIAISPTDLPVGTAGVAYAQALSASGGVAPYTYAVTAGALPAGITLAADGTLSGTTAESGNFAFTTTATDANGNSGEQAYALAIGAPEIAITPSSLPNGTGSVAYQQSLTASGGVGPYVFAAAGSLPDGLGLGSEGTLSGIPTRSGSFTFTATATDANGFAGSADYTVLIEAPAVALSPGNLPAAVIGSPYSQAITASGGAAPYGFALAGGALPDGLSLGADGVVSGTPTTGGTSEIVVEASDANGFSGTASITLRVDGALPTAADSTVTVLAGTSVTVDLTTGATGGPFTGASIVAQADPRTGTATLDQGGAGTSLVFAANPTAEGRTSVTYTLSNAFGPSNVATVAILVEARPDPSLDPEVVGLLGAQADTTRRIARAQIRNFRDRLERTHDEDQRRQGSANISVGVPSESSANDPIALFEERDGNGVDERFSSFGESRGGKGPTPARDTTTAPSDEPRSNAAFWAGGFVNFGSRDVDEVSIDLDRTLVGLSAGVDYRFTPQFVGGVGIGYGREHADIGENGTTSRAEAYSGVLYGSYAPVRNLFLDGLAGYSRLEFDSSRFVTATGESARGERSGDQVFGSLTATYEHRGESHLFAPYFGLEGSHARLDAFTENGASPFMLTYGNQDVSSLAGIVGLRFEVDVAFDWGVLTPRTRIEYGRDFAQSDRASIGYADIGTLAYGVRTNTDSRDRLEFGLGFDAAFVDGWSLALDYRPAIGLDGGQRDHSGTVRLSKPF